MTLPKTLYLASSNPGKLREFAALAASEGIPLEPLPDYPKLPPAPEDEHSFALNALEKALHYNRFSDEFVLADDSGLVVDALSGAPGPRSARYAGPSATDDDNNRALLAALSNVPQDKRTARYICVLVLARRGQVHGLFSDACEGRILTGPRGAAGFGYDPLFFFPLLNRTMAELPLEEKNRHSHRARAFHKLAAFLREAPDASHRVK
ncbi:MAG: non-canonical purine NTP pyrophosphatase [Acidobacteria bacterium]|nr:non-canonical purine NTP pyrophosphatase [Acidobacteriota bacterium]